MCHPPEQYPSQLLPLWERAILQVQLKIDQSVRNNDLHFTAGPENKRKG